jgi:hypothetical protein
MKLFIMHFSPTLPVFGSNILSNLFSSECQGPSFQVQAELQAKL